VRSLKPSKVVTEIWVDTLVSLFNLVCAFVLCELLCLVICESVRSDQLLAITPSIFILDSLTDVRR